MAILDELVTQIENPDLRARIAAEVEKLAKQKKFGLVFEEHLPECTPLWDIPVRKGSKAALKTGQISDFFTVLKIRDGVATCLNRDKSATVEFAIDDLVSVAEFGEPIYPCLKPIDTVCNAPDSDLWHTLIEAENYHALQLLEYLYAGKVDCIYIDPPYNTGAKDWKYNNDYVDSNDQYRHSKWLSMMQKRLRIAKKLLNPQDSVLIVTIDEKEYLHLGCLLEEMFPEANIQMVSTLTARSGAARFNSFSRTNEFIFFVMVGDYVITPIENAAYSQEGESVHWRSFRRGNSANIRTSRPYQFYPLYVNINTNRIIKVGDPITPDVDRFSVEQIDNCVAVFPVRDDGTEMLWSVTPDACKNLVERGYIKATSYTPNKPQLYVVQYLSSGTIRDIESNNVTVEGYSDDGGIIAYNLESRKAMPKTQWMFETHDARDYGTKILKNVIGETRFDFPKSLYAVCDSLKLFCLNKPNALIVDFFAGSGTTLHAVNLLNAEDNGHRRCILVTNNEVSSDEARELTARGYHPGDEEWEKLGIARYVTW
ncbi:MAG: site-specific DNA-methyltransferase, partial [Synergistaceae bacterium]|nr:site-specific DNA-methyltransferase [Synergistaceae bacterium]